MSSAKCIAMALLNTELKSLMQSKNKSGLNVDHWGTPHLIGINSEENPDIKTNYCRLDKYDLNQLWAKPRIP